MNHIETMLPRDMRKAPMSADASKLFPTTRWSLIVQTREPEAASKALAELCQIYWKPVYGYVRLLGKDHHSAEDLTQSFFQSFLRRGDFAKADAKIGSLRKFLTVAVKRYVITSDRRAHRLKRGGNATHVPLDTTDADEFYRSELQTNETPETIFARKWATAVIAEVMRNLKAAYAAKRKAELLTAMLPFLHGENETEMQKDVAASFGLKPGAFQMRLVRMRQKYQDLLKATVADTLTDPEDLDAELRFLQNAVRRL